MGVANIAKTINRNPRDAEQQLHRGQSAPEPANMIAILELLSEHCILCMFKEKGPFESEMSRGRSIGNPLAERLVISDMLPRSGSSSSEEPQQNKEEGCLSG